MDRKAVAPLLLCLTVLILAETLSLISLASANFTPLPELPTPIYIRNDGSVDPSTAPIRITGSTYTFTHDINNTIEVQRSNTVLDGNGFKLTKPTVNTEGLMIPVGWLPGVRVNGIHKVIITNIAFENCITGVIVKNASDIIISQNTMHGGSGIVVMSSSDISIIGNKITVSHKSFSPGMNFLPSNPDASSPYHIKIEGNLITSGSNQEAASSAEYGIWGGFSDSQMTGNTIIGINGPALYYTGSNNIVTGNNFKGNNEGVFFTGSSELSVNSTFYGNNFNGNSRNAVVPFIRDPPSNRWDNGTIGNYWSDYNGTDLNADGIGDSPYVITTTYHDYDLAKEVTLERGKDNYPLMTQLDISTISLELPKVSPSLSNSSSEPTVPNPSFDPQISEFTEQEPFPTTLAVASMVAVAVITIGLLVYSKKNKRN